jgi:hypothetical protein
MLPKNNCPKMALRLIQAQDQAGIIDQEALSARTGRKVIINAESDNIPSNTAAKSGFMANQPMAETTPAADNSLAIDSM